MENRPLDVAAAVNTSAPTPTRTVAKAKSSVKKASKHKVTRGDTLSSIASRYGVSVGDLKRVNKLKSDVAPLDRTLTIPQA
ncbi:putative peptidoglycan endopeptidase LytE precursor [compost metagenome]